MIIALGVDHGGFPLKKTVSAAIEADNHEVLDLGTFDETPVDYPDYAKSVAEAIVNGQAHRGILICGSGVGPVLLPIRLWVSVPAFAMTPILPIRVLNTTT